MHAFYEGCDSDNWEYCSRTRIPPVCERSNKQWADGTKHSHPNSNSKNWSLIHFDRIECQREDRSYGQLKNCNYGVCAKIWLCLWLFICWWAKINWLIHSNGCVYLSIGPMPFCIHDIRNLSSFVFHSQQAVSSSYFFKTNSILCHCFATSRFSTICISDVDATMIVCLGVLTNQHVDLTWHRIDDNVSQPTKTVKKHHKLNNIHKQ